MTWDKSRHVWARWSHWLQVNEAIYSSWMFKNGKILHDQMSSGISSTEAYVETVELTDKLPSGEEYTSPYAGDIVRSVASVISGSVPHISDWEDVAGEGARRVTTTNSYSTKKLC